MVLPTPKFCVRSHAAYNIFCFSKLVKVCTVTRSHAMRVLWRVESTIMYFSSHYRNKRDQ